MSRPCCCVETLTSFTDLHDQPSTFAHVFPIEEHDTIQFQVASALEDGLHSPTHQTWDGAYNVSIPSLLRPEPAYISPQVAEDPLCELQAHESGRHYATLLEHQHQHDTS